MQDSNRTLLFQGKHTGMEYWIFHEEMMFLDFRITP
jgi:hypothetical protein